MTLEQAVEEHERLIWMIARKYQRIGRVYGIELDDLFQQAVIGFINAYNKFDETKGKKFSSYCVPAMENEIRVLVKTSGRVHFSHGVNEKAAKLRKDNMTDASVEEIAKHFGCTLSTSRLVKECHKQRFTVDLYSRSDKIRHVLETLNGLEEDHSLLAYEGFLNQISDDDMTIIKGLMSGYRKTEINKHFGYSHSAVHGKLLRLRNKLNRYLEGEAI